MKGIIKKCGLILLIVTLLFSNCESFIATTDNEGPTVCFDTLSVSKSEVHVGESVKISFQVADASDIGEVYCNVVQGNGSMMGCGIEKDLETNTWTFTYQPNYYGTCEIMEIKVSDANGNVSRYLNSSYSRYDEGLYDWENENNIKIDMSGSNFEVIGGNGNDTEGPIIVMETLGANKTQVSVNEAFQLQFVVQDASDIAEVYCDVMQANGQLMGAGIECDRESGKWIFTYYPNYVGLTEVAGIKIIDSHGNVTQYKNSAHSRYGTSGYDWGDDTCQKVDLSCANVMVLGGQVGDVTGPEIVFNTLSVDKLQINVHECANISFQVKDASEVAEVYCNATQGNGSLMGSGIQKDSQTGVWTFNYYPNYYGEVEIQSIKATDTNGNETLYVNIAHSRYGETGYDWGNENSIYVDLSAANFYVGIKDDETGIFVSGSDISEDTTLDVEEKEFEGSDYDKMKDHSQKHDNGNHYGHTSKGHYDINLKDHNNNGRKFKVFFDVPWAKDGQIVRVCHIKHDGTIQMGNIPAKDGKVWMEVDEFSPFLVEEITDNVDDGNTDLDSKPSDDEDDIAGDSEGDKPGDGGTDDTNNESTDDTINDSNKEVEVKTEEKVSKDFFESIKTNEQKVQITTEKSEKTAYVVWSFDKIENVIDFIPTVQIGKEIEEIRCKVNELKEIENTNYVIVSFDHEGKLPGKAEVTLDLKDTTLVTEVFKEGQTTYLYYYDYGKKSFELIDSAVVKDGFVTFTMIHCSDYIITTEKLNAAENNPISDNGVGAGEKGNTVSIASPDTGDSEMYMVVFLLLLISVKTLFCYAYRKTVGTTRKGCI